MEPVHRNSMNSEGCTSKNDYEEILLETTVNLYGSSEDPVKFGIDQSTENNLKDVIVEGRRCVESGREINDIITTATAENKTDVNSAQLDKPQVQPSPNLKLVLKKKPDYKVTSPNDASAKAAANKIYLVTLVSNTPTPAVYSSAKYSAAGETTAQNSSIINTQPIKFSSNDSNLDKDKPMPVSEKVIQTTEKEMDFAVAEEFKSLDIDKLSDIATRGDETDGESLKSENELKSSTPKIARELQQLQKTVNESKILSEYMSETGALKSRKSKKIPLKNDGDGEFGRYTAMRRSRSRSCSKPRNDSPIEGMKLGRWPSEEKIHKRQNMRSQNSEFVQKHMKFLNRIHGDGDMTDNSDGEPSLNESKSSNSESQQPVRKRELNAPPKAGWDSFCFKCNSAGELFPCTNCIRSYHSKCAKIHPSSINLMCPECVAVDNCLKGIGRQTKTSFTIEHMNQLLMFALKQMKQFKGAEHFLKNVSDEEYVDYSKYVINPITLETLQSRIESKVYKCPEEFVVDAKWLLHNSSVYFGTNTKVANVAKSIVKICRQEVTEIEICSECYYNANTRKDWFIEVCSRPHILLWAKLKGFPYWPAKAMRVSSSALVNVRFFGDHDRGYVPVKECFLYSEKDPNPPTKQNKRSTIAECIKEVDIHIRKIISKYGSFVHAPFKTVFEPAKEMQQLEMMIPGILDYLNNTEKVSKPALTYKIVKTADNHLSIIKKTDLNGDCTPPASVNNDDSNSDVQEHEMNATKKVLNDSSHKENESTNSNENKKEYISEKDKTSDSYEVIPKKTDSEQPKINSVILKRKSDNWNTISPNTNKKFKNNTDSDVLHEQPVSSSDEIKSGFKSDTKQSTIVTAKRKYSREEMHKVQKPKLDDDQIPPLVLLTQPFVISTASSCVVSSSTVVPSLSVVTTLNTSPFATLTNPSTSLADSSSNKSSIAISNKKLVDNQKVTTLKKSLDKAKSVPVKTVNSSCRAVFNNTEHVSTNKEHAETITKSPELLTQANNSTKQCDLIPFVEIKTEKVDSDDEIIVVRSKTATPEQSNTMNMNSNDTNSGSSVDTVTIKTEVNSDDEDDPLYIKANTNSSLDTNTIVKNPDCTIKRISVKDISKLRTQSLPKKVEAIEKKKPVGVTKPDIKKPGQKARKSFPNKANFLPGVTLTPTTTIQKRTNPQPFTNQVNTSKQPLHNMVYIPVDTKSSLPMQKPIPAPPLTAVSKVAVNQSQPITEISSTMSTSVVGTIVTNIPEVISNTHLTTSLHAPLVYPTTIVSSLHNHNPPPQHMLSGFVTANLAAAITDTIVKSPPKLAPRPTGPLRSEGDFVFPSEAGPVCKTLSDNAHKMTDFFRSVIEDTLGDMANNGILEAKVKLLELEIEKLKNSHDKEVGDLKHNTDLMLCEMRISLENEKTRLISETRKQCELERIRAVEDAKTKQWCANCGKEAQFYCCWNTSYCDYPCQQKHWARHMTSCAQNDNNDANAQKIGVKIVPFKHQKPKEQSIPVTRVQTNFVRTNVPVPRNSAPIQRLIPISTASAPRYTIIKEGNWGLVTAPAFPERVIPGVIMPDTTTIPQVAGTRVVDTLIRTNKL